MAQYKISMAAARVNANLTQEDVAKAMKLNKSTIISWERGRITPKPAQFRMYCEIVGAPEDIIILPKK